MAIQDFALSFQKSPIILTGGIATNLPGGMLPIISLTQAADFPDGVLSSSSNLALEDFLFDFYPMPGGTLLEYQIGTYPFANQTTAGNALIADPLRLSLLMEAPARGGGAYNTKLSVFQSLKSSLDQHAAQGGSYNVATPSFIYTSGVLLGLRDISAGDPKRPQSRWQWDFYFPLLTLQQARQAQNALTQKLTNGAKVTPNATTGEVSYSGQGPSVGNPGSGTGPSTVVAAQPLPGASVGASTGTTGAAGQ